MRNVDAFTSQLVDFVRRMPDDALLALVRAQLGAAVGAAASLPQVGAQVTSAAVESSPVRAVVRPLAAPVARPAPRGATKGTKHAGKRAAARPARAAAPARGAAPARKGATKKAGRGRGSAAGRQELLSSVERIVKSSAGVSASEVAKSAGVPQSRASSALKELKLAKRIFQGGDRRFARYAGDGKSAQSASDNARKSASGPVAKKKR